MLRMQHDSISVSIRIIIICTMAIVTFMSETASGFHHKSSQLVNFHDFPPANLPNWKSFCPQLLSLPTKSRDGTPPTCSCALPWIPIKKWQLHLHHLPHGHWQHTAQRLPWDGRLMLGSWFWQLCKPEGWSIFFPYKHSVDQQNCNVKRLLKN